MHFDFDNLRKAYSKIYLSVKKKKYLNFFFQAKILIKNWQVSDRDLKDKIMEEKNKKKLQLPNFFIRIHFNSSAADQSK